VKKTAEPYRFDFEDRSAVSAVHEWEIAGRKFSGYSGVNMKRRRYLAISGVWAGGVIAGCLDRSDSDGNGTTATTNRATASAGPTPDVTLGLELVNVRGESLVCTVELRPASDADVDSRAPLFAEQVTLQPTETLDVTPYRNDEPALLTVERDGETVFEERIEPQEGLAVHIGSDDVTTDWVVA